MKAMGFYKTGGPEVLQAVDVPDPMPGSSEITIRVDYTSINNLDVLMRSGGTKINFNLPHIPGSDISGRIELAGSEVKDFGVGERVVVNPVYGCGNCRQCKTGNEVICREWKVPGMHIWGSYGEVVKIPAATVIRPPKAFSPEELGCMPLCLSVSWRALHTVANAKEGEAVAIRGASGNAGIFAVLLAKAMGLKVIALTRSPQKKEKLLKIGADHVIDSEDEGRAASKEVLELTGGEGVDIVVDPLGSTLDDSIAMLKPKGRVVVFGTTAGTESTISIKNFYWKSASIFGVHNANKKELAEALEFAERKGIKPIIASKMKIKEAEQAHRLFSQSSQFGKILMKHEW